VIVVRSVRRRVRSGVDGDAGRSGSSGQALPLFALMLVVLLGFAALAIDVTRVYADLRFYRATADAASLAGAQDLQTGNTRTVTPANQQAAREHALTSLEQQLGGTRSGPGCNPTAQIADCALAGSPYHVWVTTPSPTCVTCQPLRSVQVTVKHPDYGLTFARILGQDEWDPEATSVAGLAYGRSYAIITLRPPKKLGATFDVKDITLGGGTIVNVSNGDVGSNSNMEYSGGASGTVMNIEDDYGMYYFDPLNAPMWNPFPPQPPTPTVQRLPSLIEDPNYQYPDMTGAPTYNDARTSQANTIPAVQSAFVDPTHTPAQQAGETACAAEAAKVDPTRYTFMATQDPKKIFCYNPGMYTGSSGPQSATIAIGTGEVGLLKPGAYYLTEGLDVGGHLVGGYEPSPAPGVALMFDESGPGNCPGCVFSGNNAVTIALNAGTRFPPPSGGGTAASAAIDWAGNPVITSGPSSPDPALIMTVLVKKDPACFVPTSSPFIEPSGCNAGKNKTMDIHGTGKLVLEGVQYMPTDNVEITGGSGTSGRVGQIISWTLKYDGGVAINQEGPGGEGPGILRIDAACSPSESCTYP
jgi:Flp pilus assembly protein TadG